MCLFLVDKIFQWMTSITIDEKRRKRFRVSTEQFRPAAYQVKSGQMNRTGFEETV